MPPYKTVEQYEKEAEKIKGCLIHPAYAAYKNVYYRRHGKLAKGLYVCHTCDNRHCILDAHHFPGTQKANMQDASKKGRLKRSAEMKIKVSLAMSVRTVSEKTRRKNSVSLTKTWENEKYLRKQMRRRRSKAYRAKISKPKLGWVRRREDKKLAEFEAVMSKVK